MALRSLLVFLLLWLARAGPALAGEREPPTAVWSGLVLATNNPHPGEAPPKLRRFAGKLRNIFGYNQFEIIGENAQKFEDPNERWLIPSKEFFMSVKPRFERGERPGRRRMKIVLFQNRRQLAEFETRLNGAESPLFIRGPMYARGQLVIVVHAVDPAEIPPRPDLTPFRPRPSDGYLGQPVVIPH